MTCTLHLDLATFPSFLLYLDFDSLYDLYLYPEDFSICLRHVRAHSCDFLLKFPSRPAYDKALLRLSRNLLVNVRECHG